MEAVDWDVDGDPAHFASDGRFAPTESDDPLDLPAVRAANEHGYQAAPEAPIWTFLPAGLAEGWANLDPRHPGAPHAGLLRQ